MFSYQIIDVESEISEKIVQSFQNFPNFKCTAISKDSESAINHVIKLKPQLVFVKLHKEGSSKSITPELIFETFQYLQYIPYFVAVESDESLAYRAIQSGFSDFYVSEFSLHQLGKILYKFEKRIPKSEINSLCIKSYSDFRFIKLDDIMYFQSDNNTTDIKLSNNRTITTFKTLKHYEKNMPSNFIRIHKSYIVNMNYVSRIHLNKSRCYLSYNEIVLPFTSSTYRGNIEIIIKKLEQLSLCISKSSV